jgi:hypothetical protein
MGASELSHAAALITAAFVTRDEAETPEDAAGMYFRCLDALVAAAQQHEAGRVEAARVERQPKPWETPKKTTD